MLEGSQRFLTSRSFSTWAIPISVRVTVLPFSSTMKSPVFSNSARSSAFFSPVMRAPGFSLGMIASTL